MSLWELIKKGAEEGLEVLKDGISVAGKTSKILKKRVELTAVQSSVKKSFIRLGSLAYDLHSKGEVNFYQNEEVEDLISEIEDHKIRVREIETEIETIRREERRKASKTEEQSPLPHM